MYFFSVDLSVAGTCHVQELDDWRYLGTCGSLEGPCHRILPKWLSVLWAVSLRTRLLLPRAETRVVPSDPHRLALDPYNP